MIRVEYNRKTLTVKADGHAESAEKGHDLVCAAASILLYTLASDAKGLHAAQPKRYHKPRVELEDGYARISLRAKNGGGEIARLIFDSVCEGFALLCENNPKYMEYKII